MNETKDPTEPPRIVIANAKFPLGSLYLAPGAREVLQPLEITSMLNRHAHGDWGNCCEMDFAANEEALLDGGRLISFYRSKSGEKIWLLTEEDRSATTFLLPSEY